MSNDITHPRLTFQKSLRFTPYAWAKIVYMRDKGKTEVAGYGVTGTDDPLLVTDFILVKQKCTAVTFDLDTEDVAEYMEVMMDRGLMPWQYSNILIHTHPPGCSPNPSGVDEDNFVAAFSHPNWAIMLIVADDGATYCRLKMNVGPGSNSNLTTSVEYGGVFSGANPDEWDKEYSHNVDGKETLRMTGKEAAVSALSVYDETDPLWAKCPGFADDDIDMIDMWWDTNGDVVYWGTSSVEYMYNPDTKKWRADDGDAILDISEPKGPIAGRVKMWAMINDGDRPVEMEEWNGQEVGTQDGFADNPTGS